MRILACDIATVTGWAFGDGASDPIFGSQRMGRRGALLGECYVAFRDWMNATVDRLHPEVVVFEAPLLINRGSAQVVQRLMGLAAHADEIATRRGLEVYRAEGSTVTKAFTGRGRFTGGRDEKKQAVIRTCNLYGWFPTDDNAADSLALLHYTQAVLNRRAPVNRAAGPLFSRG